jgi:hypothetical protein
MKKLINLVVGILYLALSYNCKAEKVLAINKITGEKYFVEAYDLQQGTRTVDLRSGRMLKFNSSKIPQGSGIDRLSGEAVVFDLWWTPAKIATYGWWDFTDADTVTLNGTDVSGISDKGSWGFDMVQGTASKQPAYTATLNDFSVATFDGTNDQLDSLNVAPTTSDWYFLMVMKPGTTTTDGDSAFSWNNGTKDWQFQGTTIPSFTGRFKTTGFSANNVSFTQGSISTWHLWGFRFNPENEMASVFDGEDDALKSLTTGDIIALTSIDLRFGVNRAEDDWLICDIAEAIFAPRSSAEKLEGYTSWKYNLQGNLDASHPYKNYRPKF